MISTEKVIAKVNSNHLNHYKNLGYDTKISDFLYVLPQHLPRGSHVKVDMICDICENVRKIEFRGIKDKVNFKYSCGSCSAKKRVKEKGTAFSNPQLQKELSLRNNHESLEKRRKNKLNKYGDENYNNPERRKNTLKNNYRDQNYNNQGKRKSTLFLRYGNQGYNNQEKKEETCLLKYGMRHTNQIESIWRRIQRSAYKTHIYKDTHLVYQGSYELDFLNFCETNSISVDNGPSLIYSFNGRKSTYYSDFIIPSINTIVEIKSKYTLESDIDRNLEKKRSSENLGYNFIFIIDKEYKQLIEICKEGNILF